MKIAGQIIERTVHIPPAGLEGDLVIPERARAVIAFAHGSGSSRHSSRNQFVARVLQRGGLGDSVIRPAHRQRRHHRLPDRSSPLGHRARCSRGASPGGTAARIMRYRRSACWLLRREHRCSGSTSCGHTAAWWGLRRRIPRRPPRPRRSLAASGRSPTLLIVGGEDTSVFLMNQDAFR